VARQGALDESNRISLMIFDVVIVGGGPAGFFAAIHCAQCALALSGTQPRVLIFEAGSQVLGKVRISGGGRCNVTHAAFDLQTFSGRYPRGSRELLGPLSRFGPRETFDWFERRGVKLKVESDRRVFPVSNKSQSIVDALVSEADRLGVQVETNCKVTDVAHEREGDQPLFRVDVAKRGHFSSRRLMLATGASQRALDWAQMLGDHRVVPLVPSLFSFTVCPERHAWLLELAGIAIPEAEVSFAEPSAQPASRATLNGPALKETGPLLISHSGITGPAVLALSAFGARVFCERKYRFTAQLNFIPSFGPFTEVMESWRKSSGRRLGILTRNPFMLPRRLWAALVTKVARIHSTQNYANLSAAEMKRLGDALTRCELHIVGRSPFKEEFVMAGGVDLRDVNMASCESKRVPGLYFSGEVLDVDGVTGGFNLQNAWTTGYCAGVAMGAAIAHPREAPLAK